MRIDLYNKCSKDVLIQIDNGDCFKMKPLEKKCILIEGTDEFEIKVRKEENSSLQKNKGWSRYILTVETKYNFQNIINEVVSITIVRETVRVSGDAYYDKVILRSNQSPVSEYSSVSNIEYIKAIYRKRALFYSIWVSPFEHFTAICLCILVLTVVFWVKISWKFSIVFFLISYFLIWILNNVVRKIGDSIFKKTLGMVNDKTEFDQILSEKYINEFYKVEILKAYNDEIIRDEL